MKLTAIFLSLTCLQASHSQKITITVENAPVEKVFKAIKKQTGYTLFYDAQSIKVVKSITMNVKNEGVEEVLKKCFKEQPFTYKIIYKTILIKRTKITTVTNTNGEFYLSAIDKNAKLVFTHTSMEQFKITVKGKTGLTVGLQTKIQESITILKDTAAIYIWGNIDPNHGYLRHHIENKLPLSS